MALRYWVGSGNWTSSNTTNWSASSGGSGGASVPTSSDDVFFNGSSGTCSDGGYTAQCRTIDFTGYANSFSVSNVQVAWTTGTIFVGGSTAAFNSATFEITSTGTTDITLTNSVSGVNSPSFSFTGGTYTLNLPGRAQNLNFTGFSGLLNNSVIFIYGNVTFSTGMTFNSGGNVWTFAGSFTQSITSNGKTLDFPITVNTPSSTVRLLDNLTMGNTRDLTLTAGTFNANNFNLNAGAFVSAVSGTRVVTMGSGTWTLAGSGWNVTNSTGITINANTSTVNLTSASSKNFTGGGKTYYNLNQGGAGALTIQNNNGGFNNITNSVQPATIIFGASTTNTVSNFGVSGTLNNLVTLQSSTAGTRFTISKSSGTVTPQYLSIKDSAATGGATWIAQNSTNAGNNTGWSVIPPAGFFMVMRR